MKYLYDLFLAAVYFALNYLTFALVKKVCYHTALHRVLKKYLDVNPHLAFLVWYFLSFALLYLVFRLTGRDLLAYVRFNALTGAHTPWLLLLIGVCGFLVNESFTNLSVIYERYPKFRDFLTFNYEQSTPVVGIAASVLIGPAYEEILFRGAIFNQLREGMPLVAAAVVQAVLYGLLFFDLPMGIFCFAAAMLYTVVYVRVDSLWAVVLIQVVETSLVLFSRRTRLEAWFRRLGDARLSILLAAGIAGAAWCVLAL
ncbi:MAG: lysostaphin resistance A-like protein [Patescibacteria group bacterium]